MKAPPFKYFGSMLCLVGLALCCLVSACTPQGAKEIVGKWKAKDSSETMEFRSDGKMVMGEGEDKMTGKYKLVSRERLKMELDGALGKLVGSIEYKIKLEGDKLEMTDPDGEKETLERVK
jgi:uncharacterized protein (TIGR03066 family)